MNLAIFILLHDLNLERCYTSMVEIILQKLLTTLSR